MRSEHMALQERQLWDELHAFHTSLSDFSRAYLDINLTYFEHLDSLIRRTISLAISGVLDSGPSNEQNEYPLHAHRRELGILHQERELLTLDVAQVRTVGLDGCFVANGRR